MAGKRRNHHAGQGVHVYYSYRYAFYSTVKFPPIGYKYVLLEDRKYKNSKINWWDNVYGFDMSCMKKVAVSEPLVDCCENHQVCCRSQKFIEFDLYKVTPFSLKYPSSPMIKIFLGEGRRSFIQRKNRDNSYSKRIYSWAISLLSM